jgi:uncharacterized SAM-binding protein YcdF (DUF218 family)
MIAVKAVIKFLVLPPGLWLLLLLAVLVFWRRSWARKLLALTVLLVFVLHSGAFARMLGYYLESRYPPLERTRSELNYDAIVVLTGGTTPAGGLIPRPQVELAMFRRLDEAFRLYRVRRAPIIVSGGHVDPFTPDRGENEAACDMLVLWGVPQSDVIPEPVSRDTFENALRAGEILRRNGWRRYALVTSASHMPRSILTFSALAPEPVPAPCDFRVSPMPRSPLGYFPSETAAEETYSVLHEYIGSLQYRMRLRFHR